MLSTVYSEYMVQWVEMGLPVGSEMQRVIRMKQERLDSPQLPDRGAAFWLTTRAEHEMGKAWAAIGWKDWAGARKQMAIAREVLDRVEPKGQMMVAVLKAQMAEAEQKFLAGKLVGLVSCSDAFCPLGGGARFSAGHPFELADEVLFDLLEFGEFGADFSKL